MSFKLRDYQIETINTINNLPEKARGLIVLPTASGKTVIFSDIASKSKGRVLIVLPSAELREQTIDKLKTTDSSLDVGSVQARLDEVSNKIIVATRQSLTHSKSNRIDRMLNYGEFEYVIFDEVHQATEQVVKIIDKINNDVKILGFTATPYSPGLNKVFTSVTYRKTILDMISNNYLCEPKALSITSKTNLTGVKTQLGDFNQRDLEEAVNNNERNQLIVEAYKKYAKDRKSTLVFATGIDHCNELVQEFNAQGIYCKSVDSKLDTHDRNSVINEFKSGKLPVLCNVGVLTTGFDHPPVDCIIMARPTKSRILYEQVLGRGLRLSDNKSDCLIIDIEDVTRQHDLMSISDVFGIQIKNGETVKQALNNRTKEQEELEREMAEKERKRKEEMEILAQQIELFNRDMDNRFSEAYCDWFRCDAITFTLSKDATHHYAIEKFQNEFDIFLVTTEKENKNIELVETTDSVVEAIELVENTFVTRHNSYTYRDSESTSWKNHNMTEAQAKYMPWGWNLKTKWDAHRYFTHRSVLSLVKKYRRNQFNIS